MAVQSDSWGSRVGLILAMAGNAVGLGNFLRFPVQAVQNGGGAFIVPYLICFLIMGIPLLFIEWSSGRFGGKFGNHSTPYILDSMVKGRILKYIGVFGIFTNIAVAAYYCYIESWTMSYVYHSIIGTFEGMNQADVAGFFSSYIDIGHSTTGIPYEAIIFYLLCLVINTYILSKGLKGIEKVAKIGMPLLILFGAILAIKSLTLGTSGASEIFPNANAWDGFNFIWTPQYDSIFDLKVWMAAAGQIFFTLSVGMGTVHCYASYLEEKDDIALNAVSAGFMNEFVEVVLGSMIVIPIAAGYLGLDWVIENAGFGMAFQTMPYLFQQWGSLIAIIAGVLWFGLLFFAGITSSLAMGTPWIGFMRDEFGWSQNKGAWSFGLIALIMGLPTVILFQQGVFDEYDYWAGTVSLVLFAMLETILFSWIFGMEKGWKAITTGADIQVPIIYKYIIKFITPVMLIIIFMGSLFKPKDNDWSGNIANLVSGKGWSLDNGSIIKTITHSGIKEHLASATDPVIIAQLQDQIFYLNFARLMLLGLFLFICGLVYAAFQKRYKEGRNTL
ncbi:sodium-dependent transporter [Flavobacterium sp. NG2]|uniref:sodium-dependent transporter n=1 Tax=Flavobacterium sp. NG2 TaxID=3097547 RepID=UPI002A827BD2|nr:sodium-dependent transporter [Flavobacterium sp. NG2]WPR72831.1 sodium-dependent transporter [Flavobacterium sp. NG2]